VVAKEPHIDPQKRHENWVDIPPRKAYEMIFGEAVKEYNAKQTRADRKIEDYYQKVKSDKQKSPVYEAIIGVYGDDVSEELAVQILKDYFTDWQEKHPNLIVIGAYLHLDEASPHLHLDYVPIGTGYKRGLSVQQGLRRALEEMGYKGMSKSYTGQMQWQDHERAILGEYARSYGLTVYSKGGKEKHLEKEQYAKQQELERQQKEISRQAQQLYEAAETLERKENSIEARKREIDAKMSLINQRIEEAEVKAMHVTGMERIKVLEQKQVWEQTRDSLEFQLENLPEEPIKVWELNRDEDIEFDR